MDVLLQVLKNLWMVENGNPGDVHWINADSFDFAGQNSLGSSILRLRLDGPQMETEKTSPFGGPIILYGLRAWESLLRSETMFPRVLVSPGVFYLRLPRAAPKISRLFEIARNFKENNLQQKIKEYGLEWRKVSRAEAVLAHRLGNFLGSEQLLYGAYLNRKITEKTFLDVLDLIEKEQKIFLKDNKGSQEYLIYRMFQDDLWGMITDPNAREIDSPPSTLKMDYPIKGRPILYIDDHAHLGWGMAVCCSLFGDDQKSLQMPKPKEVEGAILKESYNIILDGKSELAMETLSNSTGGSDFKSEVLAKISNDLLKCYSIIILDLRLDYHEDDQVIDLDNTATISGIEVLHKIRQQNAAIPVVMLTASRKARNMEKVLDMGADAYFIKETLRKDKAQIADYHSSFLRIIEREHNKSYLAFVWNILVDKQYQIEDHRITVTHIKRALGLLRQNPCKAEEEYYELTPYSEAVLNLGIAREHYYLSYDKLSQTFDRGDFNKKLRNCIAHGKGILEEEDARIALYSLYRFIPEFADTDWVEFRKIIIPWESDINVVDLLKGIYQESRIALEYCLRKINKDFGKKLTVFNIDKDSHGILLDLIGKGLDYKDLCYLSSIAEISIRKANRKCTLIDQDIEMIAYIYEKIRKKYNLYLPEMKSLIQISNNLSPP